MAIRLLNDSILDNGDLLLEITNDAINEIEEMQDKKYSDEEILITLLEYQFGNGLSDLTGKVGLTDSIIIGNNLNYNEEEDTEYIDDETNVWYYPYYMINSYVDELIKNKKIIFKLA